MAGPQATASAPVTVAASFGEVELTARTVKGAKGGVSATGVAPVVVMVSVAACEVWVLLNGTGFGLKEAVAPAGNEVVTLSVASNEPEPVPRATVIAYVALPPATTGFGVCVPMDTEPIILVTVRVAAADVTDPQLSVTTTS